MICHQTVQATGPIDPRAFGVVMKKHIRTVHPGFAAWQKRLRVILVLALGVSVVLAISVALTISGLGYPGIAYVSGLGSFLAPFFLIGFLGRSREKKYQEEWSATHAETPAYSAAEDSTTQGFVTGDDQAIISSVNRLTPQFGLAPIEAVRVEWRDHTMPSQNPIRSSNAIMIPYDGCVFEHSKIVLPLTTKDMLSLEEWTPLVVSELLYERQFRKKRRIGLLIRIVPLNVIYLMPPIALILLGIFKS